VSAYCRFGLCTFCSRRIRKCCDWFFKYASEEKIFKNEICKKNEIYSLLTRLLSFRTAFAKIGGKNITLGNAMAGAGEKGTFKVTEARIC
jgi:hypothetical protein